MNLRIPIASGIYAITCTVTGHVYVGATCNLRRRELLHRTAHLSGKHHNRKLSALYQQHGAASLVFEVLGRCPRESLREKEVEWSQLLGPTLNERGRISTTGTDWQFDTDPNAARFVISISEDALAALKHRAVDRKTSAAKLAGDLIAESLAALQKDKPKSK